MSNQNFESQLRSSMFSDISKPVTKTNTGDQDFLVTGPRAWKSFETYDDKSLDFNKILLYLTT